MEPRRRAAPSERAQYLDRSVVRINGRPISEYDAKDAGLSVIRSFGLLPHQTVEALEALPKKERNMAIGKMRGKDRELSRLMSEKLRAAVRSFVKENGVPEESILSVKNDAVFLTGQVPEIRRLAVGGLEFRLANRYTSYHLLNGREFYSNSEKMDVKGLSKAFLERQKDHLAKWLLTFFRDAEILARKDVLAKLRDFRLAYLEARLDPEFYREIDGRFRWTSRKDGVTFETEFWSDDLMAFATPCLSGNYLEIILPLVRSHAWGP